jgi:hypothetical protein
MDQVFMDIEFGPLTSSLAGGPGFVVELGVPRP